MRPPFGLPTAGVYGLHDAVTDAAHGGAGGGAAEPASACRNDLERAVGARHPEILDIGARFGGWGRALRP